MKSLCLGLAVAAVVVVPVLADDIEYPAPTPFYPFQRSILTRRIVIVPPYWYPFRVRIYSTPQQQPYYNVPPYAVITPY